MPLHEVESSELCLQFRVGLTRVSAARQVKEDEARHHEELERFSAQHRAAWEVDVEERRRLDKMAQERDKFAAQITSRRSAEFEALKVRPPSWCWMG